MKRYTIVMQVAEVDDNGETVETFEVMGPTYASTDLTKVRHFASHLEDEAGDNFKEWVGKDTTTCLFPED